jgi:Bacterial alpha-L-rhamnosidase 6 hairpin glycosidase domain/Bacterial alpha-L-rhamnosidase C-terminal domain
MPRLSRFAPIAATLFSLLAMSAAPAADDVSKTLKSSMIWSPAAPAGTQAYVAFRKSFDLGQRPDTAALHLFADSRFLLWVNGRHVLRGPSRFHPHRPEYDTLDLTPHLRAGRNAIVVLVHHYAGATSGRIIRHDPGLTALLVADGRAILRSGADWKSSADTEYQPSPGAWSSIPDVIDGRKRAGDWTATDFDDSDWQGTIAIDGSSWGDFHPRTTPLCREEPLTGLRCLPEGVPLVDFLPLELRAGETRPWQYPGGFSGTWMWTPEPAKTVRFKTVWSNAGFGVGRGSSLMIRCDNRFTFYHNGREVARGEDVKAGWTGRIDVSDGDVLAIEAEDFEQGDRSAGLFVSMINQGNPILGTKDFRATAGPGPADWRSSRDLAAFIALSADNIHPAHRGEASHAIVIDLGRMAMAYPTIEFDADEGSTLQIEYALRFVDGRPAESYGIGTTCIARAGRQTLLAADQWCARYVTLRCLSGRVKLLSVAMTDRRYPYERIGRFECKDPLLTRLWEMAVRTVEVTTDDAHGSDARERNEWVQDGSKASFQTMRVAATGPDGKGGHLHPDTRTLRKLLIDAAASQMPDGRLPGTFPTDRGAEDPHHFIDDYALQWIESLRWHHELTDDAGFTREMWLVLVRQLDWFLKRVTSRGLLEAREYTSFDNPIAYRTCEGATVNAFLHHALCDAAWLAGRIGEDGARYRNAADALASAFNAALWDDRAQAYSAGFLEGEKLPPSVHAQLMALSSGLVPPERLAPARAWFLANFRNPGAPLVVGAKPDFRDLLDRRAGLGMPVMFHWAFTELYRMDTAEADLIALSETRARWGNMVRFLEDAGTLSESFVNDQGGGMSESCHNYGAIPAYFLSSWLLGVRVEDPLAAKRLVLNPRPADLDQARGVVVTPFGPVPMTWRIADGVWNLECTVPHGVTAELRLPEWSGGEVWVNGRPQATRSKGRNLVCDLPSGNLRVRATKQPASTD